VLRLIPSARACWAVVRYPAAIRAWRISLSLEICLFFARNCDSVSGFAARAARGFRVAARLATTVTLHVVKLAAMRSDIPACRADVRYSATLGIRRIGHMS
jgi:hypothetical protein